MSSTHPRLSPGTRRWYDRLSRHLAFITVLLTLVLTAVGFLTVAKDLGALGDLVTVCIALVGLSISLQLETLFRVAERTQTRDRYGRLLEGIEDYPDLLPIATDALDASVETLNHTTVPQFKEEIFTILGHASARLHELAQGRLRTDGNDNRLVMERFAHTQGLLRGTTDERDTAWWRGEDGKQFAKLNEKLIKEKRVQVDRIWILANAPSPQLLDLLDEHAAMRVNVFLLRSDRSDLDRRLLVNMTIRDEDFLQQDVLNREGQSVEYLYSENPTDLERASSTFRQLKSKATEYTGREAVAALFPES